MVDVKIDLVVQLAAAGGVDCVEILIALQAAALDGFTGWHGSAVRAHRVRERIWRDHVGGGVAGWDYGRATTVHAGHAAGRAQPAVAVESATVVGTGTVVTVLATAHNAGLVQTVAVMAHCIGVPASTHHRHATCGEVGHAVVGHVRHAGKAEATRCTGLVVARKGEMTVAVGVGSRWGNA